MNAFEAEPCTDAMPGVVPRTLPPLDRVRPKGPRVVVADPSFAARTELAELLRADGYDVREACDGLALLDLVAAWQPALVVTSWVLPHAWGALVLDALVRSPDAPRVVVTLAAPSDPAREEARAHGASAVFPRPFDVDDIRTAVMNLA